MRQVRRGDEGRYGKVEKVETKVELGFSVCRGEGKMLVSRRVKPKGCMGR